MCTKYNIKRKNLEKLCNFLLTFYVVFSGASNFFWLQLPNQEVNELLYIDIPMSKVLVRARIFKLFKSPRIDSRESIPPAYVAWRAGTTTLFLLGSKTP